MKIGVCYYPEQWDQELWARDAKTMVETGIEIVRIGEFAWSFMEPEPDQYDWTWLDKAINIIAEHNLKVILGTPTATPPKWLIDQYPEVLARGVEGHLRRFGSRRHYCFSSDKYRDLSAKIVKAIASHYGEHDAVIGWQTDNEYGCHDTVRSYSQSAQKAFRVWLENKYQEITVLNKAWGTAFWSQNYRDFQEIDLPNLTVTEPNPSHVLDFYRFSSDQVVSYNRLQTDIIRRLSPGRDIYHNFMGHFSDFDHFAVSQDIDVASWDSYPLGFLDQEEYSVDDKIDYMRQGHPDFAGFHHDLYKACTNGRFSVMEQQPGPVNWAPHNLAPLPGMVKLWGHEGRAHGAEIVSYFRWRQAPSAQENMHAGLLCHNSEPARGLGEVAQLWRDIESDSLSENEFKGRADIALVFDYESIWMSQIKPQGDSWNAMQTMIDWYGAARRVGQNVDIVQPACDLSAYKLVLIPCLFHISAIALEVFKATNAELIFGPRSGSMTPDMHLPEQLAPGRLQELIPIKIKSFESLNPRFHEDIIFRNQKYTASMWRDNIETDLDPIANIENENGIIYEHNNVTYIGCIPDTDLLDAIIAQRCNKMNLTISHLPEGMRVREGAHSTYVYNYSSRSQKIPQEFIVKRDFVLGSQEIGPCGVAIIKK